MAGGCEEGCRGWRFIKWCLLVRALSRSGGHHVVGERIVMGSGTEHNLRSLLASYLSLHQTK